MNSMIKFAKNAGIAVVGGALTLSAIDKFADKALDVMDKVVAVKHTGLLGTSYKTMSGKKLKKAEAVYRNTIIDKKMVDDLRSNTERAGAALGTSIGIGATAVTMYATDVMINAVTVNQMYMDVNDAINQFNSEFVDNIQ